MTTMANELRKRTNKEMRISEEDQKGDPIANPELFIPSFESTTRLRTQLVNIVKISAALDFIRSPLATEKNIRKYVKEKIN